MKIYHLKNCDTCRKAVKAIAAAGHTPELVDVRADGVSLAELEKIAELAGWEAMLNTRSTTWRGLDEADKEGLDGSKALGLIAKHPTLLKRPVIMDGGKLTIGWKAEQQSAWL